MVIDAGVFDEHIVEDSIPEPSPTQTNEPRTRVVKTKLVRLDNLIEKLQSKLIVNSPGKIPFFKRVGVYRWNGSDHSIQGLLVVETLDKFGLQKFYSKMPLSNNNTYVHWENFRTGTHLFEIKQVYTEDDFYVFEDTDGNFFHVNIGEFSEKGIMAESLGAGKPPLDTESNKVKGFVVNNTSTSIALMKDSKIVSTLVGDLIVVVNKSAGDVIVVNENHIEYISLDSKGNQTPDGHPIAHPYGVIEKMRIDRNSNFLLFISKYDDGKHKLHIVNRKTLEEIQSFDGIVDVIQIDNKNDLTCLDSDGKLVSIDTNFDQFPGGFVETGTIAQKQIVEVKNIAHSQLEAALSNGGLQIDINNLTNGKTKNGNGSNKHATLVSKLWKTSVGEHTLRELFENADDEEKINLVYDVLLQLKSNPAVSAISGITDSIESAIHDKRFQIQLHGLGRNLENLRDIFEQAKENSEAEPYKYFPTLLSLQSQLQELKKTRAGLPLVDQKIDQSISETNSLLEAEILVFRLKNAGEIAKTVDSNLDKIQSFLADISFLSQVTQVYNTELYRQTEALIEYLEDSEKVTYKNTLKELISKHISEIQTLEKIAAQKEEHELELRIEGIKGDITELAKIIETIETEQNIEIMRKNDHLLVRIRHDLESLPKREAEKLSLYLDTLFTERKLAIRLKKLDTRGVIHSLDEYGIDTSLYYSDKSKKQVSFKIIGHKTSRGTIKLELHYADGTTFDLDTYLGDPSKFAHAMAFDTIETEVSQSDFMALQRNLASWNTSGKTKLSELQRRFRETNTEEEKRDFLKQIADMKRVYQRARSIEVFSNTLANRLNLNPRSRLELPNPKFIVLDEEREILSKMSHGFDIQKLEQKGIDILEGPPGLGKTEICRFFAAITNREIVRVQCSKMDPSDLFFSPQLKAGETTRQPAEWIRLMQRPGTIILFDEIDKLNPQSFERLHSLFDNARAVYDPQIGSVRAHSDCLFVGTRNSYEKMSNPIVSRATIIQITAPSELNEAFKIAKGYTNIEFFENLDFEAFKKLWEENKNGAKGKTDAGTKKIYEVLSYIKSLIGVFTELRQRQSSDSYDEKFEYELSYRDAEQIFLRYNRAKGSSFKDKTLEILIPKARAVVYENNEKDAQEKIVREVIDKSALYFV